MGHLSINYRTVSIPNIKTIAIPSIFPIGNQLIILDEIGKMECFSPKFIEAARQALDSPNRVVGTITLGGSDFIQQRSDFELIRSHQKIEISLPREY
jgi:nucleoside-triphosphatase